MFINGISPIDFSYQRLHYDVALLFFKKYFPNFKKNVYLVGAALEKRLSKLKILNFSLPLSQDFYTTLITIFALYNFASARRN